jgi:poly-gamma-glutamate synthesis protein (capsule biosynthesis protein)
MRNRALTAATAALVLLAACGTAPGTADTGADPAGPAVASTSVSPDASPSGTNSPDAAGNQAGPRFHGSVSRIKVIRDRMTSSWRPGCPVPLWKLRYLQVSHWGYDGTVRSGELVVRRSQAWPVVRAFRTLFRARFPIKRMRLVDEYGADDDASMAANNTSAFNCRLATGGSSWSEHAYGRAIDINPIQNPYVKGGTVLPPAGRRYLNRSRKAKGMIHDGDVVVRAFAAIGWEWGGHWSSLKDYQHFSSTGH